MRKSYAILAAVVLAFSSSNLRAQDIQNVPYIEVTGSSEQKVSPDIFFLKIVIDEQTSKGRVSLEKQQAAMVAALKKLGVDTDKHLKRLSLDSFFHKRKSSLASATYELKLLRGESVQTAWEALDDLALSEVSFSRAEYGAIDSLRNEVRCQAAKDARSQAQSMAEAVGQTIGKCIYMHGGYSGGTVLYARPRMSKALGIDIANEEQESDIEFGDITVSSTVTARFELR